MTHDHHSGDAHPSPKPPPSLLRFSAPLLVSTAICLIAVIWALTVWAMS